MHPNESHCVGVIICPAFWSRDLGSELCHLRLFLQKKTEKIF